MRWQTTREREEQEGVPCEDVLGVIVPQINLCGAPKRNATGFIVHHAHKLGLCRPSAMEAREGLGKRLK